MVVKNAPRSALGALSGADVAAADEAVCSVLLGHVRQVRGWLDAAEAQITSRLAELHDTAGGPPAADLHSRCGGVSAAEGRRRERRAATIDDAPSLGAALSCGDVSAEHVDALTNASSKLATEVRQRLFGEHQALTDRAKSMSPEQFGRHCRRRARLLERDGGVDRNQQQRNETFLSRRVNPATGMIEGRFAFHPELADQVFGAVDAEVAALVAAGERNGDPDIVGRRVDRNRLAAEALGRLVAGGHQQVRPLEADITYVIDQQTATSGELHDHSICETGSGLAVPPSSIRRQMCTGRITPIIVDTSGNAIDAGRTIRHANRKQRRALRAMYRTCAFGDCDTPFDRCEIHHLTPWDVGGATDLHNLIPLCSRHHHVVHVGWTLHLAADRTLTITRPDGRLFATCVPDVPPQRQESAGRQRERRRRTAA